MGASLARSAIEIMVTNLDSFPFYVTWLVTDAVPRSCVNAIGSGTSSDPCGRRIGVVWECVYVITIPILDILDIGGVSETHHVVQSRIINRGTTQRIFLCLKHIHNLSTVAAVDLPARHVLEPVSKTRGARCVWQRRPD